MGIKAVARQSSLEHPGDLHEPQQHKEDDHVLPHTCRRMDDDHSDPVAYVEQAPGHGASPVEPGDDTGALLRLECGQRLAGHAVAAPGADRAATVARVVL